MHPGVGGRGLGCVRRPKLAPMRQKRKSGSAGAHKWYLPLNTRGPLGSAANARRGFTAGAAARIRTAGEGATARMRDAGAGGQPTVDPAGAACHAAQWTILHRAVLGKRRGDGRRGASLNGWLAVRRLQAGDAAAGARLDIGVHVSGRNRGHGQHRPKRPPGQHRRGCWRCSGQCNVVGSVWKMKLRGSRP
jgi:hypothetical protein